MIFSNNQPFCPVSQPQPDGSQARFPGVGEPHRVLQISRHETDTLRIILAAQIQLRRWRRGELGQTSFKRLQRIRAIVAARDSLLAMAVARNTILTQTRAPIAGGNAPSARVDHAGREGAAIGLSAAPSSAAEPLVGAV